MFNKVCYLMKNDVNDFFLKWWPLWIFLKCGHLEKNPRWPHIDCNSTGLGKNDTHNLDMFFIYIFSEMVAIVDFSEMSAILIINENGGHLDYQWNGGHIENNSRWLHIDFNWNGLGRDLHAQFRNVVYSDNFFEMVAILDFS